MLRIRPWDFGHLRGYIPEQPDLIDFLTFVFKKWRSLDLRINKLTKPLARRYHFSPKYIYTFPPGIVALLHVSKVLSATR